MSKSGLFVTFIILLLILGGVAWYSKVDVKNWQSLFSNKVEKSEPVVDDTNVVLPVGVNNPNVTGVRVHYFMEGVIKEIKGHPEGFEVTLNNANNLPPIIIKTGVRLSKITPPYNSNVPAPFLFKDLKPGLTIDVSLEYELATQKWIVHDIFVPTDKNK